MPVFVCTYRLLLPVADCRKAEPYGIVPRKEIGRHHYPHSGHPTLQHTGLPSLPELHIYVFLVCVGGSMCIGEGR